MKKNVCSSIFSLCMCVCMWLIYLRWMHILQILLFWLLLSTKFFFFLMADVLLYICFENEMFLKIMMIQMFSYNIAKAFVFFLYSFCSLLYLVCGVCLSVFFFLVVEKWHLFILWFRLNFSEWKNWNGKKCKITRARSISFFYYWANCTRISMFSWSKWKWKPFCTSVCLLRERREEICFIFLKLKCPKKKIILVYISFTFMRFYSIYVLLLRWFFLFFLMDFFQKWLVNKMVIATLRLLLLLFKSFQLFKWLIDWLIDWSFVRSFAWLIFKMISLVLHGFCIY